MEESKKGRWRGKAAKPKAQLANTDGLPSCETDRHKSTRMGASCSASIPGDPFSVPAVPADAKQLVHEDPDAERAGISEEVETCTLQTRTPSPASKTTSRNSSADEDDWAPVPTRRRKPSTVNETRLRSSNCRQGAAKVDVAKGQNPRSAPPLAPAVKRNNPPETGTAKLSSLQPADLSGVWKDSLGQKNRSLQHFVWLRNGCV